MRSLFGKLLLGSASLFALAVGTAALGYTCPTGSTTAAASLTTYAENSPQQADMAWAEAELRKDDIRWAQVELRTQGFYKGSLDGILGSETKRALQQFQQRNGLSESALLDAPTWAALTDNSPAGVGSSAPPDRVDGGPTVKSPEASGLGR
jgi:peptidoglycan hydrolase-like protein with peptidoglycan-binding domain